MVSGVVVLDISGRLCVPEVGLSEQVNELLEEGHREFVLNLAEVPYIDSNGLGQLVVIWNSIQNKGGRLIFLRPTDHIQQLFRLTKLNTIFQTVGEEAQAVLSA